MHSISVLCVYFLVAICILAGPFLKMIYHRKLEKFEVCVWWCFLSRLSKLVSMYTYLYILQNSQLACQLASGPIHGGRMVKAFTK